MPDLTSRLIVELVDRVSANAGKTGKAIHGISDEMTKLQGVSRKFADTRDMFKGFTGAQAGFARAKENINRITRELRDAKKAVEQFNGTKLVKGDILFAPLKDGRDKVKDLERELKSAQREVGNTAKAFKSQGEAIKAALSDLGIKGIKNFITAEQQLKTQVELTTKSFVEQQRIANGGWTIKHNSPIGPQLPNKPPAQPTRRPVGPSWRDRSVTAGQVVYGAAGFSLVQTARDGVGFIYDWEKEANRYRAQGGGTPEELRDAKIYANRIGATGKITPYQALGIQTEVLKAGYGGPQARAITGSAANLSLYGGVDPLYAAETLTAGISQFGLPNKNEKETKSSADRLADVIAFAAGETQANVGDVADVFRYTGPLASATGLSPEHIAAMYMQQAVKGIKGPEAGTAIRDILVKLISPTADGMSVLAENKIKLSDYVTDRKVLDGDGVVSGAEAKFGSLKKGTAEKIKKYLAENPDATMEEQSAFIATALESGTSAKGPQDKERTKKYANSVVGSTVQNLDYDALMTDLVNAGFTPREIKRLFTGKHAPRDIPIFQREGYQKDLNRLDKEAPGSAERQSALNQVGLPGAWSRFIASMQTSATQLDSLTKSSSGLATALDSIGTLARAITGDKNALQTLPDGSKGIPNLFSVKTDKNYTGPKSLWDYLPSISITNGRVGEPEPGDKPMGAAIGSFQVGADTAKADANLNSVKNQLTELSTVTAMPMVGLVGAEATLSVLQSILGYIEKINSTQVSPPGIRGVHADVGAAGSSGW